MEKMLTRDEFLNNKELIFSISNYRGERPLKQFIKDELTLSGMFKDLDCENKIERIIQNVEGISKAYCYRDGTVRQVESFSFIDNKDGYVSRLISNAATIFVTRNWYHLSTVFTEGRDETKPIMHKELRDAGLVAIEGTYQRPKEIMKDHCSWERRNTFQFVMHEEKLREILSGITVSSILNKPCKFFELQRDELRHAGHFFDGDDVSTLPGTLKSRDPFSGEFAIFWDEAALGSCKYSKTSKRCIRLDFKDKPSLEIPSITTAEFRKYTAPFLTKHGKEKAAERILKKCDELDEELGKLEISIVSISHKKNLGFEVDLIYDQNLKQLTNSRMDPTEIFDMTFSFIKNESTIEDRDQRNMIFINPKFLHLFNFKKCEKSVLIDHEWVKFDGLTLLLPGKSTFFCIKLSSIQENMEKIAKVYGENAVDSFLLLAELSDGEFSFPEVQAVDET